MKNFLIVFALGAILASCSITLPVSATSNTLGSKTGTSEGTVYFAVLAFGADASIQSAARNGGITKISTVDMETTNVLGIITKYKCIVTGE